MVEGKGVEIFKDCRLLILDVDGVLTDGTKQYDRDGRVVGKSFNDRDFTAIKRFETAGVRVCLLSADRKVTEPIAKKRHLDFHYARNESQAIEKRSFLPRFEVLYDVPCDQMAYVGDDLSDLPIIQELAATFCPSSAPNVVRQAVAHVLDRRGGDGLVAELYDLHETL